MSTSAPLFTVFTPTFNRAHTLPDVHACLMKQTCTDFEWLVVDDGSTDGTAALIRGWAQTSPFPIVLIEQENQGKHIAHNRALREARGELLIVLDSDDTCTPDALETLHKTWLSIPAADRDRFYGVSALCVSADGRVVGDRFPSDVFDSNPRELFHRYHIVGEKWGFGRTDILRAYPFAEDSRRVYVPEALIWFEIGERYQTRYINVPLRYYRIDGPSLVNFRKPWDNAYGRRLFALRCLNQDLAYLPYAPLQFLGRAALYTRLSLHLGLGWRAQRDALTTGMSRVLHLLAWPAGVLWYLADRWRSGLAASATAVPRPGA